MKIQLLLITVLAAVPLAAQTAVPASECGGKESNAEARMCYADELKKADSEMATTYNTMLAHFAPSEQNLSGIKGASREQQRSWLERMQRQMQASQNAFLAYRDQTCGIFDIEYEGGTMRPIAILACRVELTKQRTQWLQYHIQLEGD